MQKSIRIFVGKKLLNASSLEYSQATATMQKMYGIKIGILNKIFRKHSYTNLSN